MKRLAEQARAEMEELARQNQIEVCEYRMVPVSAGEYGLAAVSRSLLGYQNLFSQIYDAMRNGGKTKAVIGHEAEEESALEFAFSYSGSLGVVLLARNERSFFDGKLDKPIEALFQIMEISDVDSVKDVARALGHAVVKRVHDWSEATVAGGFSADIRWKRSDGKLLGQMVDRSKLEKIVEFINATSDKKKRTVSIRGVLLGGHILSRSFDIAVPEGERYSGHIADDATLAGPMNLGRQYDAEIEISETYYYATEKTKTEQTLKKLVGPLPDANLT